MTDSDNLKTIHTGAEVPNEGKLNNTDAIWTQRGPRKLLYMSSRKIADSKPPKWPNPCLWIADFGPQNGRCLSEIADLRENFGQTNLVLTKGEKRLAIAAAVYRKLILAKKFMVKTQWGQFCFPRVTVLACCHICNM